MAGVFLGAGAGGAAGQLDKRRPEHLEILAAGGRDLVGLWQNVLVLAFRNLPTVEQLESLARIQREVAERFPSGYAAIALLPGLSRPLDGSVRESALALTSASPAELRGVAMVIDGRGFLAATTRSMATGIVLLTRPRWPVRIFPGVEPAAVWVSAWVDRAVRPTAPRRITDAIKHTLI
ncbi:MAG TPA: hypothetical protein VGI39_02420 [Polyangiaceae bacterium]|jgi:hypothetical protein